jgi:hypothetical protein
LEAIHNFESATTKTAQCPYLFYKDVEGADLDATLLMIDLRSKDELRFGKLELSNASS